nr:MAG TPA: hypothetical protein [Caudoviricetes sp.]DAU40862.1 MAG TPA: hypothetical protein [Caudoviricetes sp.]
MKNLSEKRRVKSEESNSYVKVKSEERRVKNPIVKRAQNPRKKQKHMDFSLFTFHSSLNLALHLTSLFTLKINCYGECYYKDCE